MAYRLERLTKRQAVVFTAAVLLGLGGGGYLVHATHRPSRQAAQTAVVTPRPFVSSVDVVGVVQPGRSVDVVAPFDGAVASVGFTYGDPVAGGQILLRMDDGEVRQKEREAHSAALKAGLDNAEMASWAFSADVSRARRAKAAADRDLSDTQRKAVETKALLDRGLVARSEYDSELQQLRSQEANAVAAAEDLEAALKRGGPPNRTMAQLSADAARARLAEIQSQLAGTVLKAPKAGVMIRPQSAKADDGDLHVGQHVVRGQLLGSIAEPGALVAEVTLSEADADRIVPGQKAMISGGGLGATQISGVVIGVAGEARPAENGTGTSTVRARVKLDPSPKGAHPIRIGTSVNVSIHTRENDRALVIPAQAVVGGGSAAQVLVRDPRSGKVAPRPVELGLSDPSGVEVVSGLQAGDLIVWPMAAKSPN